MAINYYCNKFGVQNRPEIFSIQLGWRYQKNGKIFEKFLIDFLPHCIKNELRSNLPILCTAIASVQGFTCGPTTAITRADHPHRATLATLAIIQTLGVSLTPSFCLKKFCNCHVFGVMTEISKLLAY